MKFQKLLKNQKINTNNTPIKTHQPCPCGKSSDAFSIYSDGHGYCFSCGNPKKPTTPINVSISLPTVKEINEKIKETFSKEKLPITFPRNNPISEQDNFTFDYLPIRGLTKDTLRFYNIVTKFKNNIPFETSFKYTEEARKIRLMSEKSFRSIGDMRNASLFGKELFPAGSAKAITITEGEYDAASVYQMLGSRYPSVSVRSASSARSDCEREREYLNSFEKIYLCFDSDEPGQKAAKDVAKLFDFNKVYHVILPGNNLKDANDFLKDGKQEDFSKIWWNSKRFLPEGILSSFSEFDSIINNSENKASVPFPFKTLQDLTYGIRKGEVYLFTAMEGIGKTEVLRAIEYDLLKNTNDNIGIIHLEEGKERALKGLAGYELNTPAHLPDSQVSKEDIKNALHTLIKNDNRLHIYSHFGSNDPDIILDTIRFLVTSCNCKYIFLDHITMVVSGLAAEDERKALDYISTQLAMMVETLDFSLMLVSHVNDEGLTRGSRNISKIAHTWIHLDRDIEANNEEERNATHLTVKKNRFGARTGSAGKLFFDLSTFKISETATYSLPPKE